MPIIQGLESLGAPGRVNLAKASPTKAGTATSRTMAAHNKSMERRTDELKSLPVVRARVARAGTTKTAKTGGDLIVDVRFGHLAVYPCCHNIIRSMLPQSSGPCYHNHQVHVTTIIRSM